MTPATHPVQPGNAATSLLAPTPGDSGHRGAFRKVVIKGKDPGRASDDRTLAWVRLRSKGYAVRAIAKAYGVAHQTVREFTDNVLRDDLEYSGEGDVARSYWGGK
jgi:hypothetical protein